MKWLGRPNEVFLMLGMIERIREEGIVKSY